MTSKQVFYLLSALIALFLLAVVGGAYEINSGLQKQSASLVQKKAKLAALQDEQVELVKAKKDISTYSDLYKIARTIVPESKNQAETVRQIVKLAGQSGVTLASITFPPSTLGGTGTSSAVATSTGPSAASGGNPSLSQLKPVPKIPGVYELELIVSSAGGNQGTTYPELIHFLSALEQNRLTALVSGITIAPNTSTGTTGGALPSSFTLQLTLDMFIKP